MAQPITKSSTTQNVAMGGISVGAAVTWGLEFWRANWPDTVPWTPESDTQAVVGLTVILTPIVSRIIAFLRDPNKRHAYNGKSGFMWVVFFAACLPMAGCAGFTPALAGKTSYHVEFTDKTDAQDTQYRMDIKAPAGTELASITGMTYDWDPGGSGRISVSQDQTTDSTAQAAALVEANAQSIAAVNRLLDMLGPLMTTITDARVREGEIKAGVANDALDTGRLLLRGLEP